MAETIDYRAFIGTSDQDAAAALQMAHQADQKAQAAADAAAATRVDLGVVTLTFGGPGITITAGDKVIRQNIENAKVGDRIYCHEQPNVPDTVFVYGTACVESVSVIAGKSYGLVRFKMKVPLLALGVTLPIALKLAAFRPV